MTTSCPSGSSTGPPSCPASGTHAEQSQESGLIDGFLSAVDLLNLQLAQGWLTLDMRSAEVYAKSHLVYAWSLSLASTDTSATTMSGEQLEAAVARLLDTVDRTCPPDNRSLAILHGSEEEPDWCYEAAAAVIKWHGRRRGQAHLGYGSVKRLQAGAWEDVAARFPCLLTTAPPSEAHLCTRWYPSLVTDQLFLSGSGPAQDPRALSDLGITRVINLSSSHNTRLPGIHYQRYELLDRCEQALGPMLLSCLPVMEQHLARRGQGALLVHCDHGQSRSASLVLAYLLKHSPHTLRRHADTSGSHRGDSLPPPPLDGPEQAAEEEGAEAGCCPVVPSVEAALAWLQARHPRAQPNPGFMAQLRDFRQGLLQEATESQQSDS